MMKFVALIVVILLGSCSHEPTTDDRYSVSAAVINVLYSQIQGEVSFAAICQYGPADVPQEILARVKAQSIPAGECASIDPSTRAWRLRVKGSSKFAVVLSVDEVTFISATAATVLAHYSYGGLHAEGFTFTVRKYDHGWHVVKQAKSWIS